MNPFGIIRFLRTVYTFGKKYRNQYHTSYFSQLRETFNLLRLNKLEPYEYFYFHLANPAVSWEEKSSYLSYNQVCALHRTISPLIDRAITTKFLSSLYLDWYGIPMPKTFGIYDPRFGRSADGKSLKTFAEFREFVDSLNSDRFVFKPVSSAKGAGITVVIGREGASFITSADEKLSAEKLFDRCLEGWNSTYSHTSYGLLIQEYVQQHPLLEKINPRSLNTLRATTFLNNRGEVEILAQMVKFGVGLSAVDNLSKGGIASRVDDSGILQSAVDIAAYDDPPAQIHPDTGAQIAGAVLPFYSEAIALAKQTQLLIPQLRTLGLDIAITPTGPLLIEINTFWHSTVQITTRHGVITPGLREVLDSLNY